MYKLFIADDEATIREGIKCLLDWEDLGYEIVGEAANGDQAYQMILEHHPDLVLLDIRMPGMTGLDVIREAKSRGFDGKIIILSGYSDFSYAQEAIRYGVLSYLTKPIDEDELAELVTKIREQLDASAAARDTSDHYRQKAYNHIISDFLYGNADTAKLDLDELSFKEAPYQVVIYEKYNHQSQTLGYSFADLLRITNQNHNSFDHVTLDAHEVVLLKGDFAIRKFEDFLTRYENEQRPQKDSPLDSLFLAYGKPVTELSRIPQSYQDALTLVNRRFFCEEGQHTIGYASLPDLLQHKELISPDFLMSYSERLFSALSAFSHGKTAEILDELSSRLYDASDSIENIRLFFSDLYLQIKNRITAAYPNAGIPFPSNGDIIRIITEKCYLYEIILFLAEQFELILSSIGNTSGEDVIDDILYYIEHNHSHNLTLENIAPLFGYNSSYLGKIFNKKVGKNFNTYLDMVRIEHSKELLRNQDLKVYEIAEKVGYRNVDYFHLKFKKHVGQTPAEFRKMNK